MLVADHFFLLLEVTHYLCQRLLQNLDLVLVSLDLVGLVVCALLVLLFCAGIDGDVTLDFSVHFFLLLDFFLMFLKLGPLGDSLESQVLVFIVDLALNRQDSYQQKQTT